MRIGELNIPPEVVRALRENRLVVFVGAGASVAPPSDLPLFAPLADDIGKRSGRRKRILATSDEDGNILTNEEPIDRYLGVLKQGTAENGEVKIPGVNVHQIAANILSNEISSPNRLHRVIARLFPSARDVQIVTTNFDLHLETAIKEEHGESPDIFQAPALPVGSRFKGLVYLHGRLKSGVDEMILTDQDFGRAYLTEGFARRFLRDLFETRVVLFVGYSHDDQVVSYLARGLPLGRGENRYSLTKSGTAEDWTFLGVHPIEYDPSDNHRRLPEGLERLLQTVSAGATEQEARIQRTLDQGVNHLTREDEDYLKWCITEGGLFHIFRERALAPEWIEWMWSNDLLEKAFSESQTQTNPLGHWLTDEPLGQRGGTLIRLLSRDPARRLNVITRLTVAWSLWIDIKNRTEPLTQLEIELLSAWLAIIIGPGDYDDSSNFLSYILKELGSAQVDVVVQLFEHLTCPRLALKRSYGLEGERHSFRSTLTYSGDEGHLSTAWNGNLKKGISTFSQPFITVATTNIELAYRLQRSVGAASDRYDPQSSHRSAIAPHEQDRFREVVGILIDTARDCIEHLIAADQSHAISVVESWIRSDALLLKRIAVHALTHLEGLKPSRRARYLLEHELLDATHAHHEMYHFLRAVYPDLPVSTRRKLLQKKKAAMRHRYSQSELEAEDKELHQAHEWFEFVAALSRFDPKCPLANAALEKVRKVHPDFREREHPDFLHWAGEAGVVRHESPLTVDQVLALSPVELHQKIAELQEDRWPIFALVDQVAGLFETVANAVAKDMQWSIRLAESISDEEHPYANELWRYMFRGWRESEMTEESWANFCVWLRESGHLPKRVYEIAQLLPERYRASGKSFSAADLKVSTELALTIWPLTDEKEQSIGSDNGWTMVALNHPIGWLGRFGIQALSLYRNDHDLELAGVPELKQLFDNFFTEAPDGRYHAAVMLAGQFSYLIYAEPDWTKEHLVPLFQAASGATAVQMWDGFLGSSHINWDVTDALESGLFELYEKLTELPGEARRELPKYVSVIGFQSYRLEELSPLVTDFLAVGEEEDRWLFWTHVSGTLSPGVVSRIFRTFRGGVPPVLVMQ